MPTSSFGKVCRIASTVLFAILIGTTDAWCYEADVHYGLTLWLAHIAGFSDGDANLIAEQDWLNDESSTLSAPELVAFHVCLWRDIGASQLVRDHHFPSSAAVPNEPSLRAVSAGSLQAAHLSRDRIETALETADANLREFGSGLHPFQDSWSHQGEPDPPAGLLCDRKLSWGHPKSRHGYLSHKADITYEYPEDTISMARGTYDLLCRYRAKYYVAICESFDKIEAGVREFAMARTKKEKANWFRSHSIQNVEFLSRINIPDGDSEWGSVRLAQIAVEQSNSIVPPEPDGIEAREMVKFVDQWFTGDDLDQIAKKWIGRSPNIGGHFTGASVYPERKRLAHQLEAWRVRDHGSVVEALDGRDQPQAQRAASYRESGDTARVYYAERIPEPAKLAGVLRAAVRFPSILDALSPLDANTLVYTARANVRAGRQVVIGVLKPRHAPHQYVVVTAYLERETTLKIINIESIILE